MSPHFINVAIPVVSITLAIGLVIMTWWIVLNTSPPQWKVDVVYELENIKRFLNLQIKQKKYVSTKELFEYINTRISALAGVEGGKFPIFELDRLKQHLTSVNSKGGYITQQELFDYIDSRIKKANQR